MDKSYFAVLIGINDYEDDQLSTLKWAEKDCQDMFRALTDSKHGLFPPENVTVLLGKEATLDNIQYKLFTQVVQNRSKRDTVLVYISGHAFHIPYLNRVYLASQDTCVEAIKQNPLRGLGMHQLHDEFFKKTDARNLIFFLDTCYSGSLVPSEEKGEMKNVPIIEENFYAGAGKIAVVSSPPNVPSREDDYKQNGIFTYYIVRGLSGEAAEDNGEVTIDSLLTYIRREIPPDQPTGRYGQDYGRVLLSTGHKEAEKKILKGYSEYEISKESPLLIRDIKPLTNPMDQYQELIQKLVTRVEQKTLAGVDAVETILSSINEISDARATFVLRKDINEWVIKALTVNPDKEPPEVDSYVPVALSSSFRYNLLGPEINGLYGLVQPDNKGSLVTIALRKKEPFELLVICDYKNSCIENDIFSQIVTGLYNVTQGFTNLSEVGNVEAAILDHLKTIYKFLPIEFYNRRFSLFEKRLHDKGMSVIFQPIFKLGAKEVSVSGYEALAHDTKSEKSPSDLFFAAETWGRKFMLELDLHFLRTAGEKYEETRKKTPGSRRPEDIQDLSVNVYPESLIRTRYFKEMQDVIKSGLIPNDKLYLEISEKTLFPKIEKGQGIASEDDEIEDFRGVLEKYVCEFGIAFAIDDFGVGYSSVARLAELHPSYLKIDREILFLNDAYNTIRFIVEFVNDLTSKKYLRSAKIVLEGFDHDTSQLISLYSLKKIGIQYIQGYIVGRPVFDKLYRLDESSKDYLSALSNIKNGGRNG